MRLISVDSAKHTASIAIDLVVTYADDEANQRSDPYGWGAGDPYGLGPQIDEWMAAHPDFPIADYVPPPAPPEPPAETQEELLATITDSLAKLRAMGVNV